MFSKLTAEIIFRSNSISNDVVNHVFFMHMRTHIKNLFYSQITTLVMHKQALDVINNLCWRKSDWVAAVYDNEWYLDVVAVVG